MKEFFCRVGGFMLWVVKALLVIAGIAAAIAALAALAAFQTGEYGKIPVAAASTWILIIGLGVALGVLYFAVRGAVALLVTPPGTWNLFGDSAASRLIGLGVVAFILPRAVVSLITVPVEVLVQLFVDLPGMIGRLSLPTMGEGPGPTISPDQIAQRLLQLLQGTVGEIGRALSRLFDQIPVYDVVLALALWVIVGQLLSAPAGATPGSEGSGRVRLIAFFQKLTDKQRRYLWIGLVFFAGIYLSIAAIVAIPWLQEDRAPQNLTRERLEKALLTLVPKTDEADSAPTAPTAPTAAPADPLVQLENAIAQAAKRLDVAPGDDDQGRAKMVLEDMRQGIASARTARDELYNRSKQLREQVRQRRGQVVNEALNAFESEMLSPMSTQERAFFFRDIQRSVQEQVAYMQGLLQDCTRAVSDMEKQSEFFARESISALTAMDLSVPGYFNPRAGTLGMLPALSTRGCSPMSLGPVQYTTPDPGATWGPFAVVAQWLLRTKSQSLALITGMLGFGLLGAAIATFVRPPDTSSATTPVGDAATIMIRGLSAAIVVFLAVKGGLAIVSTSEAEPNAYVLFFTCLVGAVFSEGVWKWAKTKLDGFLENGRGGVAPPQAGNAPGAAPGAAPAGAAPPSPPT